MLIKNIYIYRYIEPKKERFPSKICLDVPITVMIMRNFFVFELAYICILFYITEMIDFPAAYKHHQREADK